MNKRNMLAVLVALMFGRLARRLVSLPERAR